MASNLKKAIAIIGGLVIGGGVTYLIYTMGALELSNEMWVGLGLLLTIASGTSLYFMMKGGGD